MGNVSREIETLRKNQREIMEIKNIVIEVENAFDGLIRRKIEEGTKEIFEVIMAENF